MIYSKHTFAIPPGYTIKEQLEDRRMTQKELAVRMGMSEKHVSRLLNGDVQLTPETANRLEMVLGVPAGFWNKLEANYREKLIRVKDENNMSRDIEIASKIPYSEMAKMGWIASTRKPEEKVINLRKFFSLANLQLLNEPLIPGILFRRLNDSEGTGYSQLVWAQKAKLEAANVSVQTINIKGLEDNLFTIRKMSTKPFNVFYPELQKLLKEHGVALVLLPHLSGSFLHGASFYDGKKIVMGLTFRGKDANKFWFSLFHELGHIIKGHIGIYSLTPEEIDTEEKEADDFARDTLIDPKAYMYFVQEDDFSYRAIENFSEKEGIQPGIVVGRLQTDNHIDFNERNKLKIKYDYDFLF